MTAMGTHRTKNCLNFQQIRAFFGVIKRGCYPLEAALDKAFTEFVPMASTAPLFLLVSMGTHTKKGRIPWL